METYLSVKVFAALAALFVVIVVPLLMYISILWNRLNGLLEANHKFAAEVFDLKKERGNFEKISKIAVERCDSYRRQAIQVSAKLSAEREKTKKLETNNKQLRTKLKKANAELIEYNDYHFRNKRGTKNVSKKQNN